MGKNRKKKNYSYDQYEDIQEEFVNRENNKNDKKDQDFYLTEIEIQKTRNKNKRELNLKKKREKRNKQFGYD